jgi:hypothetical protein
MGICNWWKHILLCNRVVYTRTSLWELVLVIFLVELINFPIELQIFTHGGRMEMHVFSLQISACENFMLSCGPTICLCTTKAFHMYNAFVGVSVHSNRSTNTSCMQTRSISQWVKVDMLHPANNKGKGCVTHCGLAIYI